MNGTKWSNIRTQLESPHKRRNQDADECQRAGVRHSVRSQILRLRILDGKSAPYPNAGLRFWVTEFLLHL
jgi:hypothetical protein